MESCQVFFLLPWVTFMVMMMHANFVLIWPKIKLQLGHHGLCRIVKLSLEFAYVLLEGGFGLSFVDFAFNFDVGLEPISILHRDPLFFLSETCYFIHRSLFFGQLEFFQDHHSFMYLLFHFKFGQNFSILSETEGEVSFEDVTDGAALVRNHSFLRSILQLHILSPSPILDSLSPNPSRNLPDISFSQDLLVLNFFDFVQFSGFFSNYFVVVLAGFGSLVNLW